MKSYIIRMTRDDQNPGDIEKVIRDLAAFLGAAVNIQTALEVRTDHPAIVGLLERMVEDLPAERGQGLGKPAAVDAWQAEPAESAAVPCNECGAPLPAGQKRGICKRCSNQHYLAKKRQQKLAAQEPVEAAQNPLVEAMDALANAPDPVYPPVIAYQCGECSRIVEKVNKQGQCAVCQLKGRSSNARLQQRIDQVVAKAKEQERQHNPFTMPEKRREFGGRKVG